MAAVNEEKLLNELFVLLEYSDSFGEFVKGMDPTAAKMLVDTLKEEGYVDL